jgi:hypothetical protein
MKPPAAILAMTISILLLASRANAQCGDRPGTPDLVEADATAIDTITFRWRNTTNRSAPSIEHTSYFDISVRDSQGNATGKDATGTGPFTVLYRSWSSRAFSSLAPNTTLCFRIRARTGKGTEGCVSEIFSAQVCATTPTTSIDTACKPYAARAYSQVMAMGRMQQVGSCQSKVDDPRWSTESFRHYSWCVRELLQNRNSPASEEKARNDILATCKPKPAITQPPPLPSAPMPPGAQCNVGVLMSLEDCRNLDDTEMKNWDYKRLSPACGLGADEEQAKNNAIEAYRRIGVGVGEDPNPGECSYKYQVIPACSCVPGPSTRSYTPKRTPPSPAQPAPPASLLQLLLKAGIDFSVQESELTQWINNEFTPYRPLGEALLKLLNGRSLRQPVYIDVIVWNYENGPGGSSPRNVADVNLSRLTQAVVASHNSRYGQAVNDFQALLR